MIKINEIIKVILDLYNDFFIGILINAIFAFIFIAIILFFKMKQDGDNKWYKFSTVSKKELLQIIMQGIIALFLITFLKESFNIDLVRLLQIETYWKVIVGVWIVLHLKSGRKLYRNLNFFDFLDNVKSGKYYYTSPQNIFLDTIEKYKTYYELEIEKIGVLKSLTPISLVPLLAGYVLEGKDIIVNWNWYTIIFFTILFFYFYSVWKCYKNIRFWKIKILQIKKELRTLEYEKGENLQVQ